MDPLKLIARAWDELTEGWRQLVSRNADALTHFGNARKKTDQPSVPDFPQWSLLAAETWETAGSIIDRLSIISLRVFHMHAQTRRADAPPEHLARCREQLERLEWQRVDLARCLATLLDAAARGKAFYRVYRQYKMYNDPTLNPWLYGGKR